MIRSEHGWIPAPEGQAVDTQPAGYQLTFNAIAMFLSLVLAIALGVMIAPRQVSVQQHPANSSTTALARAHRS
jgi:hypothetical protein